MRQAEAKGNARDAAAQAGWALPSWTYHDPSFYALERERVFLPAWQVACHVNDVPEPGDYVRFDFLGESIIVVRSHDGELRAFFNVCRHRASRLLDEGKGNCGATITCPYHAWSYYLNGRLARVPYEDTFEHFERDEHGLEPVEHEVWRGFVFVRLAGGGRPVAELLAPIAADVEGYRFEELRPLGRVTLRSREVNWKNVGDNYSDGMHIPVAHGGLTRLFGNSYSVEVKEGIHWLSGRLRDKPSERWSERAYQRYLPEVAHLPPGRRRAWCYFKLFPNTAFDIYPDQVDFMQFLPLGPGRTLIREMPYALPDGRREMRAARYLNWRINRQVNREDRDLIERVQHGMASRSYGAGPLSRQEVCLREFAETMRALLPECREATPPWTAKLR